MILLYEPETALKKIYISLAYVLFLRVFLSVAGEGFEARSGHVVCAQHRVRAILLMISSFQ